MNKNRKEKKIGAFPIASVFILVSFLTAVIHQSSGFAVSTIPRHSTGVCADFNRNAVILHGVLSKTSIMQSARSRGSNKAIDKTKNRKEKQLSKTYLLEVLDEALYRQKLAIEALDREMGKREVDIIGPDHEENVMTTSGDDDKNSQGEDGSDTKVDPIIARKQEIHSLMAKLKSQRAELSNLKASQKELVRLKANIELMGFASIFRQSQNAWKTKQVRDREFGRPQGFDGQVFYSPLGVPILVGKMNAHKDEVMRNAAQGSDLWFQVEDYNGARVLLRTSLMRGAKGSKKCRQMAADLAAKNSVWGEEFDSIPVMYTDSRKVAKRGGRVGQMKQKKSLGRILGRPHNV